MNMSCCRFIKCGRNHFTFDAALHFSHFFGTLINKQNHDMAVWVIGRDGMGNVLHHHRFTALGRSHQQRSLSFTNRGNDVNDAARDVLFALDVTFKAHLFFGKQGRQVFKHDFVFVIFRKVAIDLIKFGKREIPLTILRNAHLTFDHVASVQVEASDLARANVNIVSACGVTGVRTA